MPYNEGLLNTYTFPAGADLSGKQFYGVALVTAPTDPPGVQVVVGTTLKGIAGVLQNNPVPGQAATIQKDGVTKAAISAGQTLTAGTSFLDLDVGGTFTLHSTGQIVAQALENVASATTVTIISVMLMPANVATQ
jgi:hypothetical protein